MDQHGKNKLKMYQTVRTVGTAYQSAWSTLPAFANAFSHFTTKLDELTTASYQQSIATIGITAGRDQLLDDTIELADKVANALRAYASVTHDTVLTQQLHISKRDYRQGGAQTTLNLVDRVLSLANTHVAQLADYGIVQTHLNDLDALRLQLVDVIGSPRAAIVDRKLQTTTIEHLTEDIDKLLKDQLDCLAEVLKEDAPVFWQKYKDARIIVDHKGKTNGNSHGLGELPDGDGPGLTPLPPHGAGGAAGEE